MFIGHFAVGFAAKKASAKPSLGTYFLAVQFLDLLWPTLLLLGLERVEIKTDTSSKPPFLFTSYPYTHSLLMVLVWALLFSIVYRAIRKDKKAGIILGICVISHWLLDLIVHVPDLPLYPGNSPLFGLGLWNYFTFELILEIGLFIASILIYGRVTKAKNKTGKWSFYLLCIFLLVVQIANSFGPPPPNVTSIAWAGHLQWLIVLWGYWIDRNRTQV
jgi:hypothetical protein